MTRRILVVDDDAAMRIVLERTLTRDGHDVTLAINGADALRVLETSSFDLIITDLVMPDVEGLQLLREIRKRPSAPKVIAMSGGGRGSASDYLELAKLLGAAATLKKPFTPQQLIETMGRVCGQAGKVPL
jgi:DNA-binding NtrC family response regulator